MERDIILPVLRAVACDCSIKHTHLSFALPSEHHYFSRHSQISLSLLDFHRASKLDRKEEHIHHG